MNEIVITEKDYRFIQAFCKKYHIPIGHGDMRRLGIFLNEYKLNINKLMRYENEC